MSRLFLVTKNRTETVNQYSQHWYTFFRAPKNIRLHDHAPQYFVHLEMYVHACILLYTSVCPYYYTPLLSCLRPTFIKTLTDEIDIIVYIRDAQSSNVFWRRRKKKGFRRRKMKQSLQKRDTNVHEVKPMYLQEMSCRKGVVIDS